MTWDSTNSALNVEERKECGMTQGFLPQNAREGGLFTVIGSTGGTGAEDHGFGLETLS